MIVQELDGMPLAIEITAVYLSTKKIATEDFLSEFKLKFDSVFTYRPRHLQWAYDKQRTVEDIFDLLLDAICDHENDGLKLLRMSSLLGSSEIPLVLFDEIASPVGIVGVKSEGNGKTESYITTELTLGCAAWLQEIRDHRPKLLYALSQLEDLGLAKLRLDSNERILSFSVHSLVRKWSTRRLENVEKAELTFLLASLLCRSLDRHNDRWKMSFRSTELARTLLQAIHEGTKDDAELLMPGSKFFDQYKIVCEEYGALFMNQRQFKEAQDAYAIASQCSALVLELGRLGSRPHLRLIEGYGSACWRNGDLDKAKELFESMYQESQKAYGLDDDMTDTASRLLKKVNEKLRIRVLHEQTAHTALTSPKCLPQGVSGDSGGGPSSTYQALRSPNEAMDETEQVEHINGKVPRTTVYPGWNLHAVEQWNEFLVEAVEKSQSYKSTGDAQSQERWARIAWERYHSMICQDLRTELFAVRPRALDILVDLLPSEATKEETKASDRIALLVAAALGNPNLVQKQLRKGVNPNLQDSYDNDTPLRVASDRNDILVVQLLLDEGADTNIKTSYGTALQTAANRSNYKVMQLLLKYGAEVDITDEYKGTALYRAASKGDVEGVQLLLGYGANPNARNEWKDMSALHAASSYGHEAVVQLLLDGGAKVNAPSRSLCTALGIASELGHESKGRLLLDHGAKINIPGGSFTALQEASLHGHTGVAKLLLRRGASLDAPDGNSNTALDLALKEGHKSTVKLLRSAHKSQTSSKPAGQPKTPSYESHDSQAMHEPAAQPPSPAQEPQTSNEPTQQSNSRMKHLRRLPDWTRRRKK